MMKILWLDINSSYSHSSLAIPALHSQLNRDLEASVEWKLVSGYLSSDPDEILEDVIKFSPEYIFSTVWLFNSSFILRVLSDLFSINNSIKIILGGPEFLGDNKEFLHRNRFIHSVFRGEGEEIYEDLLYSLVNNKEYRDIKGFCYLNTNVEYRDNDIYITKNFKALKFPEESNYFDFTKPFVQVETSRGCFNSCNFCVSSIYTGTQNLSEQVIEQRIRFLSEKGVKEIRVLDRTFNGNKVRANNLLKIFLNFTHQIKFHCEIHPAFLNSDLLSTLSKFPAESLYLEAGIQSLNSYVLETCHRIGGPKDAIDGIIKLIELKNLIVHCDLIAALPNQTFYDLLNDIKTLIMIEVNHIQLEVLKLLPGTKLRNHSKVYNLKYSNYPPYNLLETPTFSHNQIMNVETLSIIIDTFYNDKNWRKLFVLLIKEDNNFLDNLIKSWKNLKTEFHKYSKKHRSTLMLMFVKLNYPKYLLDVTEAWIDSGISIKGEIEYLVKMWDRKDNIPENPFKEIKSRGKYIYLEYSNRRVWFEFINEISKTTPSEKSIEYL